MIKPWAKRQPTNGFRVSRMNGCQSTTSVLKDKAILEDRRWMIHHACKGVRLLHGMCQWILSDKLNKRHTAAKYVPRLMSNELCIAVCTELKMAPTLFPSSSLVMNLGCLGTTLRQSSSHLNRRLQLDRDQRKHKFGAMSNQCWFVFWQQRHRPQRIWSIRTNVDWKILLRRSEAIEGKYPAQTSRQVAQHFLGTASSQCTGSCAPRCSAVFSFYDNSNPPPSLLIGPHHLCIFTIPKDKT